MHFYGSAQCGITSKIHSRAGFSITWKKGANGTANREAQHLLRLHCLVTALAQLPSLLSMFMVGQNPALAWWAALEAAGRKAGKFGHLCGSRGVAEKLNVELVFCSPAGTRCRGPQWCYCVSQNISNSKQGVKREQEQPPKGTEPLSWFCWDRINFLHMVQCWGLDSVWESCW